MFKTTLYNNQIDLFEYPHKCSDQDLQLKAEIEWKTYMVHKDSGFELNLRCNVIQLEIRVMDENDEEVSSDKVMIRPFQGWEVDFSMGDVKLGDFTMPTRIEIYHDSHTAKISIAIDVLEYSPY